MKSTLLASLLGLLSVNAVAAVSPTWNYAQLGYIQTDIDGLSELDPNGLMVFGSYELSEHFFIAGSFASLSDDYQSVEVDLEQGTAGLGYKYSMTQSTDWFVALSYEYASAEVDTPFFDNKEDGHGVGIMTGVRSMVLDQLELKGALRHVHIEGEGQSSLGLGIDYLLSDFAAVGVNYDIGDDANTFGFNLRYNF